MNYITTYSVLFLLIVIFSFRDICRKQISNLSLYLIKVLVVLVVIETWVFEVRHVNSYSMAPNINPGDTFLIPKQTFGFSFPFMDYKLPLLQSVPEPGQLVALRYPADPSHVFVKRVVAVPGDVVEYRDNRLYINHEPYTPASGLCREERVGLDAYHVAYNPAARTRDVPMLQVPDGHVWVLGDNRNHSEDSRYWGSVDVRLLVGIPAYTLHFGWPFINLYRDIQSCDLDADNLGERLGLKLATAPAK